MPAKPKYTVAANDLSIAKLLKARVAVQREWKVLDVPGLSLVIKPPREDNKPGVATYYARFMAGKGARRRSIREAIGRANGPTAIRLADAKARAINIAANGAAGYADDAEKITTLRQLFDQFEGNDRDRSPRTMSDYREALERDIFEPLGDVPVAEIAAKDIAKTLTKVESRSRNAAHKCRAALGSLYKWAAKRMLVDANIMIGMGFTHKNPRRERVLSDDELSRLWRAIDSPEFGATSGMRLILKLAILTGQRNGEVAGARSSELRLVDATGAPYWRIPAKRMKRKDRDQFVFLSSQARDLFAAALALAGDNPFLFPATTHGRHAEGIDREHITQESVSRAAARAAQLAGLKDVHLHDLRKSITTWLGDNGERSDVLDRILHHHSGHSAGQRSSVTETHYNFSIMADPLRDAWQRWADHVMEVVSRSDKASNVVAMRA